VLSQQGFLHNEPEYVLCIELTDPNRYFAILKAIAAGNVTSNEITQTIAIDGKQTSTYTQKLGAAPDRTRGSSDRRQDEVMSISHMSNV